MRNVSSREIYSVWKNTGKSYLDLHTAPTALLNRQLFNMRPLCYLKLWRKAEEKYA